MKRIPSVKKSLPVLNDRGLLNAVRVLVCVLCGYFPKSRAERRKCPQCGVQRAGRWVGRPVLMLHPDLLEEERVALRHLLSS